MSLSSPSLPRALQHRESRFSYRDHRWALAVRWDSAGCEFVFEGYEKVDRGVRYFSARRIDGAIDRFLAQLALNGVYWERPYILGARQSYGRGPCELALLRHFCTQHALDVDAVYAWAYPRAPLPEWEEIILAAEWQGVAFPDRWDHWALRQLFSALAPAVPVVERILNTMVIQREERQGAA